MSKSILVTGGASSGKSRFSVTHFAPFDNVLYLRLGEPISPDIIRRIEFDNEKYAVKWSLKSVDTLSPAELIKKHKYVIFDSISSYTRLVMRDYIDSDEALTEDVMKTVEKRIINEVFALRNKVTDNLGEVILITLETGFSVTPPHRGLAAYREILGKVNQRIANTSDEVYFSASGIQFKIHK